MLRYLATLAGRHLALILGLSGLWLLLSWYFDEATLLAFGAASVAVTVWLTHHMGLLDREGVPTQIFPGVLGYLVWLTVEIGKANVLVTKEVLRPRLALSPKMIAVPAGQRTDLGRTIFGNSVTLTPGTVTVDVGKDRLVIHALTESLADEEGIAAMGAKVRRFDRLRGRLDAASDRGAEAS